MTPSQRILAAALIALAVLLVCIGMGVGSDGWQLPWVAWNDLAVHLVVVDIRIPRTLSAWAAGALLGLAGAIAQGLFRNPLADPYLLGSASGASLGVAAGMAWAGLSPLTSLWAARLGLTGAAFVGAFVAVMLTMLLARGVQHTIRLLLAGVIVGVVLGALTSLILLMAPDIMQAMQAFMLGSTSLVGWEACAVMLIVWCISALLGWMASPVLDGLSLGEATAHSLGLPLARMRGVLILALALATGTAVAQTGLIAFIGLAAPHLIRALARGKHASLLLLSSLMGGALLMAADLLARSLMAPQEIPVGVLTAFIGGGYLLWLMHRGAPAGPRGAL